MRFAAVVGLSLLGGGGLVLKEFCEGRPVRWSRTGVVVRLNGQELRDRVFTSGGWYLLDLRGPGESGTLVLDPTRSEVSGANAPVAFLGEMRTCLLGGVVLHKGGKSDSEATVQRTPFGFRIRIVPSLVSRAEGSADEIELSRDPSPESQESTGPI